jgi:hypothetical protein
MPGKEGVSQHPVALLLTVLSSLMTFLAAFGVLYALKHTELTSVGAVWQKIQPNVVPAVVVSILYGGAVFLGTMLFIIPGIVATVLFAFVFYVFVFEDKRGIDCFRESFRLTKDRFFSILLRYLALFAVFFVIIFFVSFVISVFTYNVFLMTVTTNALLLVLAPYAVVYTYLMYTHIREEGTAGAHPPFEQSHRDHSEASTSVPTTPEGVTDVRAE